MQKDISHQLETHPPWVKSCTFLFCCLILCILIPDLNLCIKGLHMKDFPDIKNALLKMKFI